jgi:hypothetical protein
MTEFELAQALFRQQQAPEASTPTTSQVRGVAASDSADGTVTVVLDATAGGASAEMEVPTTGGITEGSEVLVTLMDGAPVEVTQAGSIDGAAGSATRYITETGDYGIRVHPEGDTANYSLIDADGMSVVKGGTSVAHFGETARLGAEDGYHTEVTSEGMSVSDGTDDVVRIYSEVDSEGWRRGSVNIGKTADGTLTSVGGYADDYTEGDYTLRHRTAELRALASTDSDGAWVAAWAEHASDGSVSDTGVELHGEHLDLTGDDGRVYASVDMESAAKAIGAQSGSVDQTTNISARGYHDFDVTFDREFATVPNVLLTIYTTTSATTSFDCDIYLRAKSTTGFTARIINRENATRAPGFQWLAIG